MKKWLLLVLGILPLVACVEMDESTLITDDYGYVHRTVHYLRDKRGRDYFPETIAAPGQKIFVFDPKAYAWAAYNPDGTRVMTGGASGGKDYCEDAKQRCRTVTGTFKVYRKRGLDCLSGEYPVETVGGAKMPYCMYFFQGYTIHAAYDVPFANSSHGCVRVFPSASKWLNEQFIDIGTKVIILPYATEEKDDSVYQEQRARSIFGQSAAK